MPYVLLILPIWKKLLTKNKNENKIQQRKDRKLKLSCVSHCRSIGMSLSALTIFSALFLDGSLFLCLEFCWVSSRPPTGWTQGPGTKARSIPQSRPDKQFFGEGHLQWITCWAERSGMLSGTQPSRATYSLGLAIQTDLMLPAWHNAKEKELGRPTWGPQAYPVSRLLCRCLIQGQLELQVFLYPGTEHRKRHASLMLAPFLPPQSWSWWFLLYDFGKDFFFSANQKRQNTLTGLAFYLQLAQPGLSVWLRDPGSTGLAPVGLNRGVLMNVWPWGSGEWQCCLETTVCFLRKGWWRRETELF